MPAKAKKSSRTGPDNLGKLSFPPLMQLGVFTGANALIFFWLFQTFYKIKYSATGLYFDYASQIINGKMPYLDFNLEYPPFSLLFFILPRLGVSSWKAFSTLYQVEVLVCVLIGLWLVYSIARRLGKAPWKLMAVYTAAILVIGPITGQQYDIFPAVMTLASVYLFWLGKTRSSWALLALGTMTKLYPAVIVPVFLIYYIKNRQYRQMWLGLITFTLIILVLLAPFLIISPESIWNLISYHSERGIQFESTYSAFLLAADELGLVSVGLIFSYGSWNLVGPLADTLAGISTYLLVAALFFAYWFIYRQVRPGKSQFTRLGAYSLLLISIVLITSKVFSPQYLIWLVPIMPLIFNRWRQAVWLIFLFIGVSTFYIFPVNYLRLLARETDMIAILFIRDIMIILLAVLAVVSLRRMKPSE